MFPISFQRGADLDAACFGLLYAHCSAVPSSEDFSQEIAHSLDAFRARPEDESTRQAVRDLLRFGKYKPTGRGKPSSEYLAAQAREGTFPRVSVLVDANNLASLESGLPMSILDLDRANTSEFLARRGREGESYVFNSTGQTIELRDLLLVATFPDDAACVNPVKDAMRTKVHEETRRVLVVVYAPKVLQARAEGALLRMESLLRGHAAAHDLAQLVV